MERFIPRRKLSKKLRKRRDAEKRVLWSVPPATKRVESKKRYTRKGRARDRQDDGADFFYEKSVAGAAMRCPPEVE